MAKASSTKKPLARMRATDKGTIHHVEIHPAKNSDGSLGLITRIHRNRPASHDAAMAQGNYMPPPEPEETIHEDPQDGMQHAANALGVQPEAPEPDGDEAE